MLKKILLGASIVTATTKIVTDICEAYEEAEEKPKGLSIIPFVLQVLAKGGKDMAKRESIRIKDKVDDIRECVNVTRTQLTVALAAGGVVLLSTIAACSIYNSKNNIQID